MLLWSLGGTTYREEMLKVKTLKGALSNPIPAAMRSLEQFLFVRLHNWKALPRLTFFYNGDIAEKIFKPVFGDKIC